MLNNSGIIGTITYVEDELFHLEVDDDVVIRIAKNAISKNLNVPAAEATPAKSRKGGLLEGALGGGAKGGDKADKSESSNAETSGSKKGKDA